MRKRGPTGDGTIVDYHYGQKEPMENDAMVLTLDAQARAIWPQERVVINRIFSQPGLEVLDAGCGTGEFSSRIVKEFSPAKVVGIDIADMHIRLAKERYKGHQRLSFEHGDATALAFADNSFDVAVCRHMLQAIPHPMKVIHEMIRVVKPGGWFYALAEDYGMLFFYPTKHDMDEFFGVYGGRASANAGSDLRQGRKLPSILTSLKLEDIEVNYLCIDTLRVERDILADIFVHWRDGFEEWVSTNAGKPLEDVRARFNDMIECTRSKDGYAVWLIPSVSARVTAVSKAASRRA
jgi:SAM-dependent methyltransferase